MNRISVSYALKWRVKFATHVCFTDKGQAFNIKTGRALKRCYNSGSVGYWIDRKWHSLNHLRSKLERIQKEEPCPF